MNKFLLLSLGAFISVIFLFSYKSLADKNNDIVAKANIELHSIESSQSVVYQELQSEIQKLERIILDLNSIENSPLFNYLKAQELISFAENLKLEKEQELAPLKLQEALRLASEASQLTQGKRLPQDVELFERSFNIWGESIQILQEIPVNSEIYTLSQSKYEAYLKDYQYIGSLLPEAQAWKSIRDYPNPSQSSEGCSLEEFDVLQPGRSEPEIAGNYGYIKGSLPIPELQIKGHPPKYNQIENLTYNQSNGQYSSSGFYLYGTKVKVIDQDLAHEGYGKYEGYLLVQSATANGLESSWIDKDNFTRVDYWNCSPLDASKYGDFLAEITFPNRDNTFVGSCGWSNQQGKVSCYVYYKDRREYELYSLASSQVKIILPPKLTEGAK